MDNQAESAVIPVLDAFIKRERLHPDKVWLIQPMTTDETLELTWGQAGDQVRRLAGWLQRQGLPERSTVAVISENCAHWIISDLAIWMAGHVSVPLSPALPADAIQRMLEHADVRIIIVGKLDDWQRIRSGLPVATPWVGMPMAAADEQLLDWHDLQRDNEPMLQPVARDAAGLATIMYSVGSSGLPKGCMLSFASMHFAATNFLRLFLVTDQDRVLSWLSLCHVAERQFTEMQSLLSGMAVYFVQSRATLIDDLRRARPTLFLGTPATWHGIRQSVMHRAQNRLIDTALKIPLLGKRVASGLLEQQGLDQLRFGIISEAVAPTELLEWYHRLGLRLFEMYGLTENCGYSHVGRPGRLRPGWCGLPNPGVECRLGENREVLVRSQAIMLGYHREPETTARTIDEQGFLHTGDRGEINKDGFLRLSGRISDLFHTAEGREIVPQPIEHRLLAHGFVQYTCVVGEGLPLPLALLSLTEPARALARHDVERELESLLHALNKPLPRAQRLSSLVVLSEDWTPDNGWLTGTRQLKRGAICARYQDQLGDWSTRGTTIIWEDS